MGQFFISAYRYGSTGQDWLLQKTALSAGVVIADEDGLRYELLHHDLDRDIAAAWTSASQRANWPGKLSGLGIYYAAVSFKGDASVVAWQHKLPGEGFSACSRAKHVALL